MPSSPHGSLVSLHNNIIRNRFTENILNYYNINVFNMCNKGGLTLDNDEMCNVY